jgi:hypothetical protein
MSIAFTNGAKFPVKIRGCLDPKGFTCKPYKDCDLTFAPGATETIVLDKTFKYFVFTYRGDARDTELYPDANMKWRKMCTIKDPPNKPVCRNEGELDQLVAPLESAGKDIVIHSVTPGNHAHCTEIFFVGGKDNEYYKAHGYQYTPPIWEPTPCPAKYNWFNNNKTIAAGVTEELRGIHTR